MKLPRPLVNMVVWRSNNSRILNNDINLFDYIVSIFEVPDQAPLQ